MSKKRVLVVGAWITGGILLLLMIILVALSVGSYETNRCQIADPFYHVRVITETAHVSILPAEDRITAVECYEQAAAKHTVTIKDGTLTIELQDEREWYQRMGLFESPYVYVYLPSGVYSDLTIQTTTGDVEIASDFRFNNIDVDVTTGNVTNRASAKGDIALCTDTGNVSLLGCDAASLNVKTDTGNVSLLGCDAASLNVKTDTGDVTGNLLSEKVFIVHTETGDVNVPDTTTGGRCEITTDTGDIYVTIP